MADTAVPETKEDQNNHYWFNVVMTCTGCSGAVERVLKRLEGVQNFEVSLEKQTADVYTNQDVSYETVLEKIKKTGKQVKEGKANGEVRTV